MISIDRAETILNELAEELPPEIFTGLTGGINLLPRAKRHPESVGDTLYILGEYIYDPKLGRRINIYFGSFERMFPYAEEDFVREKLRETLRHEFVHHVEGLAGENDLETEDRKRLADYRERYGRNMETAE